MLLHPYQLNELIALDIGVGILGVEHSAFAQLLQALKGVCDADTIGQRQQSGTVHKGAQPLHLGIQRVFLGAAARHYKVTQAANRWPVEQGVLRHLLLEQRIAANLTQDFGKELFRAAFIAPYDPEIEINRRAQEVGRRGAAYQT